MISADVKFASYLMTSLELNVCSRRPGRGQAKRNIPSSITYNKDIAVQTVRWAMIEWFNDTNREGMWAVSRLAPLSLSPS